MCKFHQEVARDVATDDAGRFDPVLYNVVLLAAAKYRIEQHMPDMAGCGGFDRYEMVTPKAVDALKASGIEKPLEYIQSYRDRHIDTLRGALAATIARYGTTAQALGLPEKSALHDAFLDEATDTLFEGFDTTGMATKPLELKTVAHKPAFQKFLDVTRDFAAQPGVGPILGKMVEHSFAKLFIEARQETNPQLARIYSRMPRLPKIFNACAMCVRDGGSAAIVTHFITCVLLPGALGAAFSHAAMGPAMLISSPLVAVGVGYTLDKIRKQKISLARLAGSAALAFGIAGAYLGITGHATDKHAGHKEPIECWPPATPKDTTLTAEQKTWFDDKDPETQKQLQENAQRFGKSLRQYIETSNLCSPTVSLSTFKPSATPRPGP